MLFDYDSLTIPYLLIAIVCVGYFAYRSRDKARSFLLALFFVVLYQWVIGQITPFYWFVDFEGAYVGVYSYTLFRFLPLWVLLPTMIKILQLTFILKLIIKGASMWKILLIIMGISTCILAMKCFLAINTPNYSNSIFISDVLVSILPTFVSLMLYNLVKKCRGLFPEFFQRLL